MKNRRIKSRWMLQVDYKLRNSNQSGGQLFPVIILNWCSFLLRLTRFEWQEVNILRIFLRLHSLGLLCEGGNSGGKKKRISNFLFCKFTIAWKNLSFQAHADVSGKSLVHLGKVIKHNTIIYICFDVNSKSGGISTRLYSKHQQRQQHRRLDGEKSLNELYKILSLSLRFPIV